MGGRSWPCLCSSSPSSAAPEAGLAVADHSADSIVRSQFAEVVAAAVVDTQSVVVVGLLGTAVAAGTGSAEAVAADTQLLAVALVQCQDIRYTVDALAPAHNLFADHTGVAALGKTVVADRTAVGLVEHWARRLGMRMSRRTLSTMTARSHKTEGNARLKKAGPRTCFIARALRTVPFPNLEAASKLASPAWNLQPLQGYHQITIT